MNGERPLSLPDRYYQGSNYVVRPPDVDAKIRLLMAGIPSMGEYKPPIRIAPGESLPSAVDELLDHLAPVPVVCREAPTGRIEQAPEVSVSFRQKAARAIVDFFRGN